MPEAEPTPQQKTKLDALKAVDAKLRDAGKLFNDCTTLECAEKMTGCINALSKCAADIRDQAYVESIDDPECAKAIAKIQAATEEMNTVASNMASATAFIQSMTAFFTAANKVVPALKGLG
jgi:hypothetical protein